MNYYKIKLLLKGKEEEVFVKAEQKGEAIQNAEAKYGGVVVKAELSDMPFDERIKELKNIIEANFSKKKLDYNAFIGASRQLAALTKAQISIKDSLDNISKNTTDPLVKELFEKASEGIDNGFNLSSTFEQYEAYIGNLAVAMIKLGEQTGALGEALEALADIYEDIETNRQKFKKAMRYPLITLTAMAGAFTVLIMYVVPKFKEIFEQLHTELPLPTRILLGAEYVLNHYLPFMIAVGIALGVAHKYLYKTSKNYKYKFDAFLLKLKIIGPVIQYSSISRFMLVLTELTKAGIPLID